MSHPGNHYTKARKIHRGRYTGVYVTHEARRLRRQRVRRQVTAKTVEYGKDALWGAIFFTSLVMGVVTIVIGGLLLFG